MASRKRIGRVNEMLEAEKMLAFLLLAGFHYDNENACLYSPDWTQAFYDIYDAKVYLDNLK
jgi:hypothetical protein